MINIPFLPSLAYKDKIDNVCQNIEEKLNIKYFVCYIIFNNGQTFVLSNTYPMLGMYYGEKLYNQDFSYRREIIADRNHYLCEESMPTIGKDLRDMLEQKFSMFRSYYIIRSCPECRFVFGAIKGSKSDDHAKHYKKTFFDFQDFCVCFVDCFIDIIKIHNNLYSNSFILTDRYYRHKVIKNEFPERILTEREKMCLYWLMQGKTSEEIAIILNNKKTTINTHKRNIMRKMDVKHMAQAVLEAVKRGEIGAFNNWWKSESDLVLNGFSVDMKEIFLNKNPSLSKLLAC